MQAVSQAVLGLEEVLTGPTWLPTAWTSLVRQRMSGVDVALRDEPAVPAYEPWLSARRSRLVRERMHLRRRLRHLMARAEEADTESVRRQLHRLACDIARHERRINALAYDAVEMEVGGSE